MFSGSLYKSTKIFNKTFKCNSWCEVPSPHRMLVVWVREEIILFLWISFSFSMDCFNVLSWSWVFYFNGKLAVFVDEVDEFIKIFELYSGIHVSKILPNCVHYIHSPIFLWHFFEIFNKFDRSFLQVVPWKFFVVNYGLTFFNSFEIAIRRWTIVVVQYMRKDLSIRIVIVLFRPPYKFKISGIHPINFILIINPSKEKRVKTQFAKNSCGWCVMAKRVDVPCNIRNIVEGLFQPTQTYSHLVYEILVVYCCFIWGTPPCVDKLYLTAFD